MFRNISIILATLLMLFSTLAIAQEVEYVSSALWAGAEDIQIVDNFAYCAFLSGFVILDITVPSSPYMISQYYLQGGTQAIHIAGRYAYLGERGIKIFDINNPANPILVGSFETPGNLEAVHVQGDYAYIVPGANYSIEIVDISDPENPFLVSGFSTSGSPHNVFVDGDYAYSADGFGVGIYDVSNPISPVFRGRYDVEGVGSGREVIVVDNLAYLAFNTGDFFIIDVSDPENPIELCNYDLPAYAVGVYVSGDYAYIADGYLDFQVLNVSDPENPLYMGSIMTPGSATRVFVSGIHAFLADHGAGVQVISVADPTNPEIVGSYNAHDFSRGIYVSQGLVGAAGFDTGLQLVNVADPANPFWVGSCDTPGTGHDVYIAGNYAYVFDYREDLKIIDISNPRNPYIIGTIPTTSDSYSFFVLNRLVYLVDYLRNLHIIDVTEPSMPFFVGHYSSLDYPSSVDVIEIGSALFAFVADAVGLQIIDVTNPETPVLIASCDLTRNAEDVVIEEDYAYVVDGHGLKIFDIRNLDDIILIGDIYVLGGPRAICVSGDYAYIAANSSGVYIADISDRANPILITRYETPNWATNIFVSGEFVFVNDIASVIILRFDPLTGIVEEVSNLPEEISVSQNYPNPFNPATTIEYTLPEASRITIEIYDILGGKVETLKSEKQPAGYHQITWDATAYSSGLYFYRIQAGKYAETRKMVLLK